MFVFIVIVRLSLYTNLAVNGKRAISVSFLHDTKNVRTCVLRMFTYCHRSFTSRLGICLFKYLVWHYLELVPVPG